MDRESKLKRMASYWRNQDWDGFVMEILSVVIGIAITFAVDSWISDIREEKELKATLKLVVDELKDNVENMERVQKDVEFECRAAEYLMKFYGRFEECNEDSMKLYCNAPLQTTSVIVSSEALELLKTSSLFQKIKDKNLSLDIIRAYRSLESEAGSFDFYDKKKEKLLDAAMQEEAKALFATTKFNAAQMWTAMTSTDEGRQFLHEITISVHFGFGHEDTMEFVKSVIKQLEEETE